MENPSAIKISPNEPQISVLDARKYAAHLGKFWRQMDFPSYSYKKWTLHLYTVYNIQARLANWQINCIFELWPIIRYYTNVNRDEFWSLRIKSLFILIWSTFKFFQPIFSKRLIIRPKYFLFRHFNSPKLLTSRAYLILNIYFKDILVIYRNNLCIGGVS